MSWQATRWAKKQKGLSRTEKLVLIILADYHDRKQDCAWPSVSTLADDSELTERRTYVILASLKDKGAISVLSGGGRTPNQYRFPALKLASDRSQDYCSGSRDTPDSTSRSGLIAGADEETWSNQGETIDDDRLAPGSSDDLPPRQVYEALAARYDLPSEIRTPDLYWSSYKGTIPVPDVEAVDRAVGFAVDQRSTKQGAPRPAFPGPSYLSGLQTLGRGLPTQINRMAGKMAIGELESRHEGQGAGTFREHLLVFLAQHSSEFLAVYYDLKDRVV